jgi:hypothetical protein
MALSSMDLCMALGAPILGNVVSVTGYTGMFGLSSLLIVVLILIYMMAYIDRKVQSLA